MNRSKHRKICECCGKPVRPGDTAFERRSTAESDLKQRAKAVSPPAERDCHRTPGRFARDEGHSAFGVRLRFWLVVYLRRAAIRACVSFE
jgi:hypothetical protein